MKYNIMIVEDEKNQADLITMLLNKRGFNAAAVGTRAAALKFFTDNRVDLVLTDYKLPDGNGLEIITELKKLNPEVAFVVMTAFGDVETAVKCLKSGAGDFLAKPVDMNELERIIFKLLQNRILVEEVAQLRRDVETLYSAGNICGTSERLTAEIGKAIKAAPTDSNVMIYGESGTGKELFANLIHYNSARKNKAFIKVNCSAIPADLIESELFGHLKGSFTGAYADKTGKFEAADGGTLFLDEIGELPMNLQAKLLRVIQEREIEPIGSTQTRKINVRLLFATNRDLEKAIKERQFREDLYYRVNTIALDLPPLRERREDIPILIKYFVNRFNPVLGRNIREISSDALDFMIKYPWPGNIRELQNIVENTMVLMHGNDEVIYIRNLPDKIVSFKNGDDGAAGIPGGYSDAAFRALVRSRLDLALLASETVDIGAFLDDAERIALEWASEKTGGVKTNIARMFGMDEKSVRNKFKKYNIL